MSETPGFESPIVSTYPSSDSNLALMDLSGYAKTVVRAAPDSPAAAGLGVAFGSSARADGALVCGMRPDEWVLLGTAETNQAVLDGLDLSGFVSVIDHTHSRALFRLTGEDSHRVLEKICGLDWDDLVTPDGAVASASVAKVNCDLVRHDRGDGRRSYLIACDRSFGQYLFDAILDAGDEFGIGVDPARS